MRFVCLYAVYCFYSDVERGDEIYSLCQVPAAVQDKPSSEQQSLPQQQEQQEQQQQEAVVKKPSCTVKVFRPKCLVDSTTFLLPAGDGPVHLDVNDKNGPTKTAVATTTTATTANVIKKKQQNVCSSESPKATTAKIFAPRTEDMNKGFLTFSDDDTGLTSECGRCCYLRSKRPAFSSHATRRTRPSHLFTSSTPPADRRRHR